MDNIEEQEHIRDYLPGPIDKKPRILITSRKRNWELSVDLGIIRTISLNVFSSEASREYITKCLDGSYYKEGDVPKLSQRLNNYPLSLKQAVGHIIKENKKRKRMKYTISDYLNEIEKNTVKLLNFQNEMDVYKFTVMTAWKMTVDKLVEKHGEAGVRAKQILELIAYLKPDQISIEHIFDGVLDEEAISLLEEYSMVEIEDDSIVVHRMVQEVTRINIKQCGREEEVLVDLIELLHQLSIECIYEDVYFVHVIAVWDIACYYPRILDKFYYKLELNPLVAIMKGGNPNMNTLKMLVNFEYENHNYDGIYDSLEISMGCDNLNVFRYFYNFINEKDDLSNVNLNNLFEKSLGVCNNENIFDFFIENGCDINHRFESQNTPIILASKQGNEAAVNYLLNLNCDIALLNSHGENALMTACTWYQNGNVCKVLIASKKFDLNMQDDDGNSLISLAFRRGNKEIVSMLLGHIKIDLSIPDVNGRTHFMYACYSGHFAIVKNAIDDGGFDLNIQDNAGMTGLMLACQGNSIGIVCLLIADKRTDLTLRDKHGQTALFYAALRGVNFFIFIILLNTGKYSLNDTDINGWTLLMKACRNNNIGVINELIKEDSLDPNVQNDKGETALMIACQRGDIEAVHHLVGDNRTDLNMRDINGNTALYYTVHDFSDTITRILLETGEYDFSEICDYGSFTMFICACSLNYVSVVQEALELSDIDVNVKAEAGLTGLMVACSKNNIEVVRLLVDDSRTDLKVRDKNERSALFYACGLCRSEVLEILLETGKCDLNEVDINKQTPLMYACECSTEKVFKMLMENDGLLDVNLRDITGMTALMIACEKGNSQMVQLLIDDKRTDLTLRDALGRTAIFHACTAMNGYSAFKTLVNSGKFNLNDVDCRGRTTLMVACEHNPKIAEYLIKNESVDVNAQDNAGVTGLMIACENNKIKVVRLLVAEKRTNMVLGDRNGRSTLHYVTQLMSFEDVLKLSGKHDLNKEECEYAGSALSSHDPNERPIVMKRPIIGQPIVKIMWQPFN